MKKIMRLIIIMLFIFNIFGCDYHEINNGISLPEYFSEECYWDEGFRDYDDYCKYFYNEKTIKEFESKAEFKKVTESDIKNIKSYFENFNERVESKSYYDKYDFDYQSQIKEGDYFCIIAEPEREVIEGVFDKFYNYNVYYVDMSKGILYFIHSNT